MKKDLYKQHILLPDWLFPYLGEIDYRPKKYMQIVYPHCKKGGWAAKLILQFTLWEVWNLCPECLYVLSKRSYHSREGADEC